MKSFKSYVFCSLFLLFFVASSASASLERRQVVNVTNTNTDRVTPTPSPSANTTAPANNNTTSTPTNTSDTSRPSSPSSPVVTTPNITSPPVSSPSNNPAVNITAISGSDVTITLTGTHSSSQSSPASSQSSSPSSSSDSGLGTGSIIGLSVAGGVAILGVIGFFVWKFTRKHNADFDDNEAIKWPDLNNHGTGNTDTHPLPVKNTGRAGFDTASEADLSLSQNYSTPDFNPNPGIDPYAVPPLPHLNPNQPYRDDPTSTTGFYDPYRGPVPGSIEGAPASTEWGSEAIPMTQLGMGTGRMSPAPQVAYAAVPPQVDMSAAAAYDTPGRRSPGPYAAYASGVAGQQQQQPGGRISPGPQLAYNTGTIPPYRT